MQGTETHDDQEEAEHVDTESARESLALRERWRLRCLEARVEYRFATTAMPPAEVLRSFLFDRQRARR